MRDKTLGQIAYDAYFEFSKGKSLISGAALPAFAVQNLAVQNAWEAAALAVTAEFVERGKTASGKPE